MSRSYKAPYATQRQSKQVNTKLAKRLANKRVRQTELGDGGDFRKASASYDICDWSFPDSSVRGRVK